MKKYLRYISPTLGTIFGIRTLWIISQFNETNVFILPFATIVALIIVMWLVTILGWNLERLK